MKKSVLGINIISNRTNFYQNETSEIVWYKEYMTKYTVTVTYIDIYIIAPPLAFNLFAEVNIPTVTNIDVSF